MSYYEITVRATGAKSVHMASNQTDALTEFYREAGYDSIEDASESLEMTLTALLQGLDVREMRFRIAPRAEKPEFDLAGEGNWFASAIEAGAAAKEMDVTSPLDGDDEWCVYETNDAGGWRNVTR